MKRDKWFEELDRLIACSPADIQEEIQKAVAPIDDALFVKGQKVKIEGVKHRPLRKYRGQIGEVTSFIGGTLPAAWVEMKDGTQQYFYASELTAR